MDARDSMLIFWPEEINASFTVAPQGYTTPAFDGKHAANEFTSQEELMAFLKKMDAASGTMHLYSAGTTPNYKYDLPLALFTTSEIPANATLAEAAKIVKSNGKVNIWYQAQIHPNEPAAGEGALVMIDNFVNDPTYKALLDKINIVIVPRINPDGSYLFSRATYDGFDMNRDHMSLKAAELAQLHTAYRLFMSEVVLDTHEFTFYGAYNDDWTSAGEYMENADDLETTPATSLNNNPAVTKIGLDMAKRAFSDATNAGLRVNHYGTTVNNPIGRAYFGLFNAVSFLIETRGIGAGRQNFERRVFSQEVATTSYITYAAEHADEIMKAVAAAFGKPVLRETNEADVINAIPTLRERLGDRAVLRALHFFEENARVARQRKALLDACAAAETDDAPARDAALARFFADVQASGRSSFCYLQNVYTTRNIEEQGLSLALCLCDTLFGDRLAAFRVHGGGFAGTVQAWVPAAEVPAFRTAMDAVFGSGTTMDLQVRPLGAARLL